jgi:excisionase family DNA binding protein
MATITELLVPIQEAAKEWGVSVDTLYRLITAKKIGRYRKGGDRRTFVDREEIKVALGFRRVESEP